EHVGERHVGAHDRGVAAHLLGPDLATPAVDVADDVANEIAGRHHLHVHDRLEQLHAGLDHPFTHGAAGRNLEGNGGGVDLVVGAVEQRHLHVDHGEADQHTAVPYGGDALFNTRNVLLRHHAADDRAFELVALAGRIGFKPQLDARKLSGAARL